MNEFRIRESGEVVTEDQFRESRPEVFPAVISPEVADAAGVDPVFNSPVPPLSANQFAQRDGVVQGEDGSWFQKWVVVDASPEEVDAALGTVRAQVWELIKAERAARQNGGVLVAGKWFHTDEASRSQYLSLKMMGDGMPSSIQWKTMDNTFVTMTMALVNQIFIAIVVKDQAIFSAAEQHRAALEAAEVPGQYDFSAGWPDAFEPA